MTNGLSQDEVDSLLGGISEGTVETETDVPEDHEYDLKTYDFRSQAGPIHLRLPTLGIINERFVGFLKANLTSSISSVMDVSLSTTETIKFGEFCGSLPLPTNLNIFNKESFY